MDERRTKDAPDDFRGRLCRAACRAAAIGLLYLVSGCSSVEMKGTPFYTGEYAKRQGPAEQRVNVWPIFYYRDPALSVLWPLFEFTDDHTAFRPFFSVYGLDRTNRDYSVLWPLSEFNRETRDSHIFPVFWGPEYFVTFPLYWHFGEPYGAGGGSDSLFPLWIVRRDPPDRFSLYLPWPLFHTWHDKKIDANGSWLFPVYWQQRHDGDSQFVSLLWMNERKANGDYWRMLFPLYFQNATENSAALVTPVWAQGHTSESEWKAVVPFWISSHGATGGFDTYSPWPLARFWSDPEAKKHGSMVLPFYWHQNGTNRSQFFSLPWWSSTGTNGSYWRLLPPLFYQSASETNSMLLTLPWSTGSNGDNHWQAVAPFWIHSRDGTNRSSVYSPWPLARFWSDSKHDAGGSWIFPLYYQKSQSGVSQFYSLLWFSRTARNGDYTHLLLPLYYGSSTGSNYTFITPLWAQGRSETNDWRALIPLCYWDRQQHTLLSPLWAYWQSGNSETWVAPELLSWKTRSPDRSDLWMLGGVAHASWGEKPGPSHVFPLYYRDPAQNMLLSPLWLQWQQGDTETAIVPELLAWKNKRPDRTDLWMLGGLARASWGPKPGGDYFFPLFYHDSAKLLTPLFGWDKDNDYVYAPTPIAGVRTGGHSGSWLFPLYSHSRVKETGEVNDNYLLLGGYKKRAQWSRSWFAPLFYYRNRFLPDSPAAGRPFGIYGKFFWCLPICWYENQVLLRPDMSAWKNSLTNSNALAAILYQTNSPEDMKLWFNQTNAPFIRDHTRRHGVFPLWSFSAESTPTEQRTNRHGSFLLWLYDYKHTSGPPPGDKTGEIEDYTRSRVLWRIWHYERLNGNVSVDVFPSFTYDHKTDGYKKISFLWRFFRYERAPGERGKLDVLFIPLKR